MRRLHWWMAAAMAMAAAVGCTTDSGINPNEKDFPGAPGSSVPLPPPGPASEGGAGGMTSGDGAGLPSSYPGLDQFKKAPPKADAAKPEAEEPKPAEEAKPEAAKPAEEAKPAFSPVGSPVPAAPAPAPKPDAPGAEK